MFIELDWLIQTINQLNWFWLVWIVSSVHLNSPIITYSWIILVFRAYKKLIFRNYNSILYFYFILFFIYNGRNQTKANKPQRADHQQPGQETHIYSTIIRSKVRAEFYFYLSISTFSYQVYVVIPESWDGLVVWGRSIWIGVIKKWWV